MPSCKTSASAAAKKLIAQTVNASSLMESSVTSAPLCIAIMTASTPQLFHRSSLRHQNHAGHPDEKAVLHNPRQVAQPRVERRWIVDPSKMTIQNMMPFVVYVGLPSRIQPPHHARPQIANLLRNKRLREADHLDRQRKLPQRRNLLRRVRHHDHLLRRRSHDFLPQHRPSAALDQIQMGIELVRSVDRHIDLLILLKGRERNPEFSRQAARRDRSRVSAI